MTARGGNSNLVAVHVVIRSQEGMQSFLGLTNYYRQFVKDFSKVTQSLNKLTRKDYI